MTFVLWSGYFLATAGCCFTRAFEKRSFHAIVLPHLIYFDDANDHNICSMVLFCNNYDNARIDFLSFVLFGGTKERNLFHLCNLLLVGYQQTRDAIITSLLRQHYNDVIMSAMAFQITSITNLLLFAQPFIQGADQRKYQSSASLAFVKAIYRWLVNSTHKGPVTQKMFPFDDVIMKTTWRF